jgi:hypothetical protein
MKRRSGSHSFRKLHNAIFEFLTKPQMKQAIIKSKVNIRLSMGIDGFYSNKMDEKEI